MEKITAGAFSMALPLHSTTQKLQPKQLMPQLPTLAVYIHSRASSLTTVSVTSAQQAYFFLK